MVELRKRKVPPQPPIPEKKSKKDQEPSTASKPQAQETDNNTTGVPNVGDTIALDGFGGEIETNEGSKTTLKEIVNASQSGVVLFTYPKASTPGCTKQACLFRNNYEHLTSTGLSIYGLSADSPKANTTFKSKQNLPYPLLCDPGTTLIAAIGFKKAPKGTTRGIFSVDKEGKVLIRQAGGPDATVEAVQELVSAEPNEGKHQESKKKKAQAKLRQLKIRSDVN